MGEAGSSVGRGVCSGREGVSDTVAPSLAAERCAAVAGGAAGLESTFCKPEALLSIF